LRPSEPTPEAAPAALARGREVGLDETVAELVASALAGATPRAAALALLRFDRYLALIGRAGLEVSPGGALASALRAGLSRICRVDADPRAAAHDSMEER
jgi:hypothetical protein